MYLKNRYGQGFRVIVAADTHRDTRADIKRFFGYLISGKLRVDDLEIQFPPSMQEEAA